MYLASVSKLSNCVEGACVGLVSYNGNLAVATMGCCCCFGTLEHGALSVDLNSLKSRCFQLSSANDGRK
jgi:hypothetical protein